MRRSRYGGRLLMLWVGLLGLAQIADLVTTEVDRLAGGVETNQFAAFVLMVGGAGLFLVLKLMVVAGMAVAVLIALRYRRNHPGERAERCLDIVARTLQGSVVLLTVTAVGNAHVAAQIAASASGAN
ncbi:MAG: hypothetical protein E6I73_09370 [Chloroflexi bacterium]|nr:MAG: hypothetical protein E6I73_09370 [Chloroflexota bacterium]